jgi:glucose/arabinose dehydrogenase
VQRGHITRDIVFSKDGRQLFVSVGSATNVGESMGKRSAAAIAQWEVQHGLGSAWGDETDRADVLVFDPDSTGGHTQPASETALALPCIHSRESFGARPMSAMASATISFPTT